MTDRFDICVDRVLEEEGGYVNHPKDPGGATNMGITHKTLAKWRGKPVTKQDVKDMTRDEAKEIYRANYWNKVKGDDLPVGVDCVVFDFGVNAGPGRSIKYLQRVVGSKPDGIIGPNTLQAVDDMSPEYVVNTFSDARLGYYRSLKTWKVFGNGWRNRTERMRRAALGDITTTQQHAR